MTEPATILPSPFHRGEQHVQRSQGVRQQMERFGRRVIRDHMPEQHRQFYGQLPFVFVGHSDDSGRPWASILFNKPGFMQSSDSKHLTIHAVPVAGDPLGDALKANTRLGLLGIELPTRRRNRLSAHIIDTTAESIQLGIDQAFGNCPQYIQSRELRTLAPQNLPMVDVNDLATLDERAQSLIARSDTFFVASAIDGNSTDVSSGADVSHRGGMPGFVRIDNATTLTIPDYVGNNHFNTLGNFIENPRAGLLFLDFENGHILTLTGTVEIDWEATDAEHFEGAQRLWRFHLDYGRWINHALPLRWKLEEYSPNSLLTGTWPEAKHLRDAKAQRNLWLAYTVTDIVQESAGIKSFHLEPQGHTTAKFEAGQFLTVKAEIAGQENIRTYTVSSAPADVMLRITVKRERTTNGDKPDGVFSNFLHDTLQVGDVINAKAPNGAFTLNASESRPAVFLAGGIGITPMVSMARHAMIEGVRSRHMRPITLIASAHNANERAFFSELTDLAAQSAGLLRNFSALSELDDQMEPGRDYHHHGRISAQFLQRVLPIGDYDFYLCGPGEFMQSMYDLLRDLGVGDARIFAEAFGPASLRRACDTATEAFVSVAAADQAIVEFTRSQHEQAWSKGDGSLLDFAEAHGLTPEFGCRSGQCGACKATLLSGAVSYQLQATPPLDPNEVLLCCAVPAKVAGEDVARLAVNI
jgi:ferredoxin-NADP reductase/predicted pyridoxine 5'-phosphate oxidase superfamily flavin-nucleotide-binding protein